MNILIRKIKTVYTNPKSILIKFMYVFSPIIDEKIYLKMLYRIRLGKQLNLKNPKSYNEKLQWLKLFNRNPFYTQLVDKYEVKEYVKNIIGDNVIIPTLGIWNNFNEIDFERLPNQFVLKTTHDSGGVYVCNDKTQLDLKIAERILNKHIKINHYLLSREWPYKNVKPRIIAEKYMVDDSGLELKDYKFFCFNGEPKALFIATERLSGDVKFDFFDIDFNHLDIFQVHKQSGRLFEKPKNYDLMVDIAKKLSICIPHVRIDLYNINGQIYFGEYTFFHHGGLEAFHPKKWDKIFGDWIKLDNLNMKK